MFISKEEKERHVIDLYSQGKTYRQIAEEVRISPNDIHAILKKKEEDEKNNSAVTNNQKEQQELSSKGYKLFSEGKTSVQIATTLNLRETEMTKLYREYCKLKRQDILNLIDKETNGKLGSYFKLYKQLIKEKGMTIDQVVNVVEIAIHKLPHMESLYGQVKDQVYKLQATRQLLSNDIEDLKYKISLLDKITFSSEQDCKRKQRQVQELIDQKNILEKLIANILNGEGYSKLRQVVIESVKAVLSEKKELISISFVPLIQTLKADPQMVKLIQNIPSANDSKQHEDNDNNNVIKYLELKKDRILDLSEKNYENLVEVLTNSAINNATHASSTSPFFLPQSSSSTFPNLSL